MRRLLARDNAGAAAAAAGCRPCQRHIAHYCFRVLLLNLDEWPIDPTGRVTSATEKKKKIALKRMPNKKMGFIFIYLAALMDLDGAAAFFLRFIFFLCSRALDATIIYSYRHFFIVLTRISFGFICCVGKIERMKKVFSHVRQPRHRAPSSDLLHFLFCSTILCFPLSIQLSSGECTWCLAAS